MDVDTMTDKTVAKQIIFIKVRKPTIVDLIRFVIQEDICSHGSMVVRKRSLFSF